MTNITVIFALHPISADAKDILRDPRNKAMSDDLSIEEDQFSLVFSLDRAPKVGTGYVIGRNNQSDIVLSDPESSARHCLISISNEGVPKLHEQSSNGTYIDGVCRNNETVEIIHGMRIGIRKALFDVWVPWRGQEQEEYEYNARRARERRARTPLDFRASFAVVDPCRTAIVQKLGRYELTNITVAHRLRTKCEIVRRETSFFTGKWFRSRDGAAREVKVWSQIKRLGRSHPNIVQLEEVIRHQSSVVIITEFLPLGSLQQCENLTDEDVVSVMQQLLRALDFLHNNLNLIHRAVLRDNILVKSRSPIRIKLAGFEYSSSSHSVEPISMIMEPGSGFSKQSIEWSDPNSILIETMTIKHQAPEIVETYCVEKMAPHVWYDMLEKGGLTKERNPPVCGKAVDLWDAGTVCCELLFDIAPTFIHSEKLIEDQELELISFIVKVESEHFANSDGFWAETLGLSQAPIHSFPLIQAFLRKLLDPNPVRRGTAKQCLADPWLKTEDKPEDLSRKRKRAFISL